MSNALRQRLEALKVDPHVFAGRCNLDPRNVRAVLDGQVRKGRAYDIVVGELLGGSIHVVETDVPETAVDEAERRAKLAPSELMAAEHRGEAVGLLKALQWMRCFLGDMTSAPVDERWLQGEGN